MKLYYAEWPNKTISIVHAPNLYEAYWILDEEGEPTKANVWSADSLAAIISSRGKRGLQIMRENEHDWTLVKFPSFEELRDYLMNHIYKQSKQ